MNNVTDHPDRKRLQEQFEALKSGGGDGTFDGMEARVKRLEDDMSEVRSDVKDVRERIARIEGEIRRLPGYPGIATIVALVGGCLLIVSRLFPSGLPTP